MILGELLLVIIFIVGYKPSKKRFKDYGGFDEYLHSTEGHKAVDGLVMATMLSGLALAIDIIVRVVKFTMTSGLLTYKLF